jgi:hypothetical protein
MEYVDRRLENGLPTNQIQTLRRIDESVIGENRIIIGERKRHAFSLQNALH